MTDSERLYMDCWRRLINLWHCSEWTNIPDEIQSVLHFDTRLGMFNGMLVTRAGAGGIQEFVKRMNAR